MSIAFFCVCWINLKRPLIENCKINIHGGVEGQQGTEIEERKKEKTEATNPIMVESK